MAHSKRASKRKRRRIALPVLGAAGASLAMAGGASATVPIANVPSQDNPPLPITLYEEEIFDVNLATFYVFDRENADTSQLVEKVAARGCRGCAARGCGGCAARGCGLQRLQRLCSTSLPRLRRLRLRRRRSLGRLRRLRRLRLRALLTMDATGLDQGLLTASSPPLNRTELI